jgi:hypothetical protein
VLKLAPAGNLTYLRPSRLLHLSAIALKLLLGKGGRLWHVLKNREPRPPSLAAVRAANLSFRATPQTLMSAFGSGVSRATCQSSVLGLDDVPPEPQMTVAEP